MLFEIGLERKQHFEKELCEFAIAHVESKTEQAYRHAKAVERRRPLMQTWSDYLSGIPNDNILVFRKLTGDPRMMSCFGQGQQLHRKF